MITQLSTNNLQMNALFIYLNQQNRILNFKNVSSKFKRVMLVLHLIRLKHIPLLHHTVITGYSQRNLLFEI